MSEIIFVVKSHCTIACINGYEIIIKDIWLTYPKRSTQEISLTYPTSNWFYNFKEIGRVKYNTITKSQTLILTNPHLVGLAVEKDTNIFLITQFFPSLK